MSRNFGKDALFFFGRVELKGKKAGEPKGGLDSVVCSS